MKFKIGQRLIDVLRGKCEKELASVKKSLQLIARWGGELPLSAEYKQNNIKEYANEYNCKVFIETGTYLGDTTNSMIDVFDEIYTIELSKDLYEKAQKRFENVDKIKCFNGDSKDILPAIIENISQKPLFWLDAHYSAGMTAKADKETPIMEELEIILNKFKNLVILIDDARCFGTESDYPSIFALKRFVKKKNPNAEIELYDDIIRIVIE